jgi:hypothetical protein
VLRLSLSLISEPMNSSALAGRPLPNDSCALLLTDLLDLRLSARTGLFALFIPTLLSNELATDARGTPMCGDVGFARS